MSRVDGTKDTEVLIRVYHALQDQVGPEDEYDFEMAVLDDWTEDFGQALKYAETDEQAQRSREAIAAAQALRRAIMGLAAARGVETDESGL